MANVFNQKEFFDKIYLTEEGNVVIIIEEESSPTDEDRNQYEVFNNICLTPEGYLKVYINK